MRTPLAEGRSGRAGSVSQSPGLIPPRSAAAEGSAGPSPESRSRSTHHSAWLAFCRSANRAAKSEPLRHAPALSPSRYSTCAFARAGWKRPNQACLARYAASPSILSSSPTSCSTGTECDYTAHVLPDAEHPRLRGGGEECPEPVPCSAVVALVLLRPVEHGDAGEGAYGVEGDAGVDEELLLRPGGPVTNLDVNDLDRLPVSAVVVRAVLAKVRRLQGWSHRLGEHVGEQRLGW